VSTDDLQGTGVHPDLDTLADLQEGLLPPTPAAAVSDHLDQCPTCRTDFAALGEIPGQLAGAADVGPMPDELVSRLDEALATEPRTASVTITPLAAARRNRLNRDNRVLQLAAAAVLVLAATGIGISAVQDRGGQMSSGDKASAAGTGRELAEGSVPVLSTGTDYTQASVVAAVPRLLAADGPKQLVNPEADAPTRASDSAASGYATRLTEGPALSACVIALTDDPDTAAIEMPTPLVVDVAKFDGQPATVIVLPTADQADRLDVYVVGPDCGPDDAKVLHFARVPRP
jgi:anti-sigma factor RsiW